MIKQKEYFRHGYRALIKRIVIPHKHKYWVVIMGSKKARYLTEARCKQWANGQALQLLREEVGNERSN